MSEEITMNLGASLVLAEVSKMLLYKTITNADGQQILVDRDIPFRLRYRLNKDRILFERDAAKFNQNRMIALAKYGEMDEAGETVSIKDPEKMELFKEEISKLVDSEVTHPIALLSPEDIDLIKDTDMPISPEAMSIFIGYLVDDPDMRLEAKVAANIVAEKREEATAEEPKVEDSKPVKKTKKTTTKKETVDKPKKAPAKKKTTTKEKQA